MRVRTRLTPSHDSQIESLCVMFLEDLREIEARLRTEKLAAMGRMSAAVAHEIRNPLAAIAQANALMEEDLREPALQAAQRAGAQERAAAGADRRRDPGRLPGAAPKPQHAGCARTRSGAGRDLQRLGDADAQRRQAAAGARGARRLRAVRGRPPAPHAGEPAGQRAALRRPEARFDPCLDPDRRRPGQHARVERRRTADAHRCSATCSSPSSLRKAAPAGWASTSAASCASATAPRMGYRRSTAGSAGSASEGNEFIVRFGTGATPLAGAASFDTIARLMPCRRPPRPPRSWSSTTSPTCARLRTHAAARGLPGGCRRHAGRSLARSFRTRSSTP